MFSEDNSQDETRTIKKRQPNLAHRTAREAIRLVQGTNSRIAGWQLALARHMANAERMTRRGEHSAQLREALETMRSEVASEEERLEQIIASASPTVTANSRVHDSKRALQLIDDRIAGLIAALDKGTHSAGTG